MEQKPVVRRALDIALAAQGVDAAACHAHVAEQELDDGHGPDVLGADGMLGPAHGIELGARPVRLAGRGVELVDLNQFLLRRTGDARDLVEGVAGIMFFQKLVTRSSGS